MRSFDSLAQVHVVHTRVTHVTCLNLVLQCCKPAPRSVTLRVTPLRPCTPPPRPPQVGPRPPRACPSRSRSLLASPRLWGINGAFLVPLPTPPVLRPAWLQNRPRALKSCRSWVPTQEHPLTDAGRGEPGLGSAWGSPGAWMGSRPQDLGPRPPPAAMASFPPIGVILSESVNNRSYPDAIKTYSVL